MRRDKRVFVIGEDVGVYGGAFKVTLGFQEEFGPWRVIDAPLSETAIVGGCTGAAIMGMRPVAEMQFADFISCALGPPRHRRGEAALARRHAVPIVVRLPSGGGFSGGPFHSQNPESLVRAHPRPEVRLPGHAGGREGPAGRPRSRIRTRCSSSSTSTCTAGSRREVPDERYTTPIGKARIHREGEDITRDHLGRDGLHGRRGRAELEGRRVSVEIVDLRTIMPWDKQAVLECVRKTSKVLVLHEDTRTGGFGAEIAATIAEEAFEDLDAPVQRIAAPDTPVPFSPAAREGVHPAGRRRRRRSAGARRVLDGAPEPPIDVVMPQMGVSVSEGTITKWLKQRGRARSRPTSRCSRSRPTRSTPRCRARARASSSRSSSRRARRSRSGRARVIGAATAPRRPPRSRAPEPAARAGDGRGGAEAAAGRRRARAAATEPQPPEPPQPGAGAAPRAGDGQRRRQDLRLAGRRADRGRARRRPGQVPGHRPRRPRDEEGHPRLHRVGRQAARRAAPRLRPARAGRSRASRSRARRRAAPQPAAAAARRRAAGRARQLEPMTAMRRGIAEHMRRSLDTSAHVTSAIEVDMSKVVAIREKLKKEYQASLRRQPDLPRASSPARPSTRSATTRGSTASCAATRSSRATTSTSASRSSSPTARA